MKRIVSYILILVAVLFLPTKAVDVGKLRPVQTIAVYTSGSGYRILTDTMDSGFGKTMPMAIEDLKATTPAVIYLDTAQYLVVNDEVAIEELYPYLNDHVKVCLSVGEPHMENISSFLTAHADGPTVKAWKNGAKLPVLNCSDGRMSFQ